MKAELLKEARRAISDMEDNLSNVGVELEVSLGSALMALGELGNEAFELLYLLEPIGREHDGGRSE